MLLKCNGDAHNEFLVNVFFSIYCFKCIPMRISHFTLLLIPRSSSSPAELMLEATFSNYIYIMRTAPNRLLNIKLY